MKISINIAQYGLGEVLIQSDILKMKRLGYYLMELYHNEFRLMFK